MECPIGGPRCFEGCAKGNLALNYSPMSYTTEGPSVPYNATLSPCHRPAFRRVGSGGTDAHVRDDGRHCPMHVDAAPEARSMAAQRLANG